MRDVEPDLAELERLIDDVLTTLAPRRDRAADAPRARRRRRSCCRSSSSAARHDPVDRGHGGPLGERAARSTSVTADGALLRRALWNLVENAAKYGAPPITLADPA